VFTIIGVFIQARNASSKNIGYLSKMVLISSASSLLLLFSLRNILSVEDWQNFVRFNTDYAIQTSNFRRDIWHQGLSEFGNSPFFGQSLDAIKGYLNVYLQVLNAGGLILFLVFFGRLVSLMRRNFSSEMFQGSNLFSAARLSLLAWLISGITTNSIFDRNIILVTAILTISQPSKRSLIRAPRI
jgi:O-antigen ligase